MQSSTVKFSYIMFLLDYLSSCEVSKVMTLALNILDPRQSSYITSVFVV